MIKRLFKNRIFKNASWLIAGKVLQMLINLIVGILTARYLGPANRGLIDYAASYTAFFSAFCTLGINSVLVKEFVDCPQKEGMIIGTTLVLRSISSFFSAIVILCIARIADAGEPTTLLVVMLSCIGMLFQVFDVFNYWFQSKLQSKVTAIVSLIAYVVTALYKAILLVTNQQVEAFAFATALDYICIGILLLFMYKRTQGGRLLFSWDYGKAILKKSCHFILPTLMVSIYGQTDKIMLKQMISNAEIGYYSIAVSTCSIWCFVLSAIIDSVYPSIMEANKIDEGLFKKRNKQLYAVVFYVSVSVSLLFLIFGELVIKIMYGDAYLPAVAPLRIITWYTAFSYWGVARNAWIVCKNRQKYLVYVYAASAVANVVLNVIFIPIWGASGAAFASLVAQVFTTMVVPLFIKELRENSILMFESIFLKF